MKIYEGLEAQLHPFFRLSSPVAGQWSISRPNRFTPRKAPQASIEEKAAWAPAPVWTFAK